MLASDPPVEVLGVPDAAVLGEGPWWDAANRRLWWVDILGRKVHRSNLGGQNHTAWTTDEHVGFAVPCVDGATVLGLRSGLARLDPISGRTTRGPAVDAQRSDHRINDGKTDRRGRLWFGTMHDEETDPTSALYRSDERGLMRILGRVTTSNGLGWSPDDRVMYYTDSMTRSIVAYEFRPDEGAIGAGRVFATDPDSYVPDGLTVDTDGCVWSAKWNGGKVIRYAPSGRIDREIRLPVTRPTSCMFVDDDLRTLAVTSAKPASAVRARDHDLAGRVLLVDVGAQGIVEHPATFQPTTMEAITFPSEQLT